MKSEKFASCNHYCRNQAKFQNENWLEFANFPEQASNILDTSNDEKLYQQYFSKKKLPKLCCKKKFWNSQFLLIALYRMCRHTQKKWKS